MSGVYLVQPSTLLNTIRYKFGQSENLNKRIKNYGSDVKILCKIYVAFPLLYEEYIKKILSKYVYSGKEYIKFNNETKLINIFNKTVTSTHIVISFIFLFMKKIRNKKENIILKKDKYECISCSYSTISLYQYEKHLITQSHKKNTLKLLDYKNTNIEHISLNEYFSVLKLDEQLAIQKMFEIIHINFNATENMNLLIINIENKIMKIYENDKWIIVNLKKQIQIVLNDIIIFFRKLYDKYHFALTDKNIYNYKLINSCFSFYTEKIKKDIINKLYKNKQFIIVNSSKIKKNDLNQQTV